MSSIAVIGAGGNIGSHLVPHLGRMHGVERVILVDRDRYEAKNFVSQDILPSDINRPKAEVQARRLRCINHLLRVEALVGAVEELPVGRLRSDVFLAALDSRAARQWVNEIAWRLGVPWIDAGVRAEGLLARVKVYLPGEDTPCLECGWSDSDYATLEQEYPCQDGKAPAPTEAPSALGSLAASLQALECEKVLAGRLEPAAAGRQITIDAGSHKHYVTSFRRNPECRFDHRTWSAEELASRYGKPIKRNRQ